MLRKIVFALVVVLSVSACSKAPHNNPAADTAQDPALMIAPEDIVTLHNGELASGPVITGSIQPELRADLRAEVTAMVLKVLKDNGETVKKGDLLLRLDDTSIRENLTSANAAVRAAAQSSAQAERQLQRLQTLRNSGMATLVQLEDAENHRNAAHSDLIAAQARAAQANQQLQRTEIRAPFDGIVSERKVSTGDTAQIGMELVKVIGPSSMRFEGLVSADQIGAVTVGQKAHFRINGYGDQLFNGIVKRVDPAANATTRQVQVLVGFASGSPQPTVSGLYAEGRIETGNAQALMIPDASLVRNGDSVYTWRIQNDTLQKVKLTLGERDDRSGDYVVKGGVASGDRLLRAPGSTLKEGQKIKMVAAAAPSAAPNAANAGR